MATVIGVKFRTAQKIYYFDPAGEEFRDGDGVILESQRGVEYARAVFGNKEVDESEIVAPLKPVMRKATPKDDEQNERNLGERDRLIRDAKRKVADHGLPMKIVDAEYTFDRAKVIIYFTAESRIDFRELVRDLAGLFHNRIELRQIYERDDIKLRGALARMRTTITRICTRGCPRSIRRWTRPTEGERLPRTTLCAPRSKSSSSPTTEAYLSSAIRSIRSALSASIRRAAKKPKKATKKGTKNRGKFPFAY